MNLPIRMPQRANKNVIPKTVEELKSIPCKRGHSREDAYVFKDPYSTRIVVNCKTCAILYHRKKKK
jgi:hypothetical protein